MLKTVAEATVSDCRQSPALLCGTLSTVWALGCKSQSCFVYSLKPVPRNRLNYTTLNHIIIITIQNPIRKTTANAA